jgi:TonB family protein
MRALAAVFLACLSAFAQQPSPDGAYRVGNGVTLPKVIGKTDPEYAEEARKAKLSGAVMMSVIVGEDGKARDIRVVRPLGLGLDEKAIDAVRTWQFSPGMKDGMPVAVRASIEVNFRLLGGPWSVSRIAFNTPEGVTRPVVTIAPYPPADPATGENGTVTISCEIGNDGIPANLHIEKSSSPAMESEAIAILRGWQFRPAVQNGQLVSVQGTFDFVKGKPAPPPPASLPPPQAGIQRIQVAPKDQEALLENKITPQYPPLAKAARVQGTVRFTALVDPQGRVQNVQLISGPPLLVSAATQAVRQWTYRPTLVNGTPVEVTTDIAVEFKLDDSPQ